MITCLTRRLILHGRMFIPLFSSALNELNRFATISAIKRNIILFKIMMRRFKNLNRPAHKTDAMR